MRRPIRFLVTGRPRKAPPSDVIRRRPERPRCRTSEHDESPPRFPPVRPCKPPEPSTAPRRTHWPIPPATRTSAALDRSRDARRSTRTSHRLLGEVRCRFFRILFSIHSFATSCRSRVSSASSSLTRPLADTWVGASPRRARATRFANVFADISNDPVTARTLRPPSTTRCTAAFRNSGGQLRFTLLMSNLHPVKIPYLVATIFRVPDQKPVRRLPESLSETACRGEN